MSGPISHQKLPALSFPQDEIKDRAAAQGWQIVELPPMMDLRNLGGIVKRKLLWLLLIPVLTVSLSLIYLYQFATHYYESGALIYIDPEFDRILQIEKVNSITSDLDSLNSLEQAIISDSMILRVLDKLKLRNNSTYLPKSLLKYADTEVPMNGVRLLKGIRNRYSASLVRPTRNIQFVAYDTDAERAQLIANTFVTEFESFLGEQKRNEADISKIEMRTQAAEANKRALKAELELDAFRKNHPDITVEQDHNLVSESLSKAGEELNRVTSEVIALQSKVEALQDIDPDIDPGRIITVGNFSKLEHVSDLMSARTTARTNFAVISDQYTPLHPKYTEAENRVREIDLQMAQLAADFKASVWADYEGALKNEAELKRRVASFKDELNDVKTASSEFRAVKQQVETEWNIFEQLQKQIGETTISAEKSTAITKLFSEPLLAYKTTKPKKSLVILAAGFLGCLGSLCLVGMDLFRDGPFANRDQVEDTMKSPVLAQLSKKDLHDYNQKMTRAMAQIILTNQHEGCQIFHVIHSGNNAESSARVAAGIANISAYYRAETMIIRTHEAGPRGIFHLAPIPTETKGLYQLDIPSSLLLTEDAWHLLSSHCRNFKRIVIDSSQMAADSQLPLYFGRYAQQNIFVIDQSEDFRGRVTRAAERFRMACNRPVSVVLVG